MLRGVCLVALLGGCDVVFSLDHVPLAKAPCGPYTTLTPLTITGVTNPTHFSITPDGTLAMVVGKDASNVVRPILLTGSGTTWAPDVAARQTGLNALVGAHLAPQEKLPDGNGAYSKDPVSPAIMAWLGHPLQTTRYYYSPSAKLWANDVAVGSFGDPDYDVIPGNTIVSPNGTDPTLPNRHVTLTEHTTSTANHDQILLTANNLPSYGLVASPTRTQLLDESGDTFDQAVLTDDQQTLVYSAKSAGSFEIFASAKGTGFDVGDAVQGMVDTPDHDELEPWIDATCSKLYFRRVTVGQSGDPGTIFVAE
ncbi:MAG: hypothetical protein JO257_35560 [Deltaproteobacteria bacterium]|nr:hypothetical protein [Deltaproteobacteria bacterium]